MASVTNLPTEGEVSETTSVTDLLTEGKMSEIADFSLPSEESEMAAVSLPSEEAVSEIASVYLPQFILLKSNNFSPNLLGCVKGNPDSLKHFVKFYAERVGMLEAKFEVHRSTTGNGLVHIRNCYNNRYLVLNNNNDAIVAKAETTEENQSKRSCTLFRPTFAGNANTIRLTNVHLGKKLSFWRTTGPYEGCLLAHFRSNDNAADNSDLFTIINWDSLVILPRYVAFQNANLFLKAWNVKLPYFQFEQRTLDANPTWVGHEIIQTATGNIHIRNMYYNKYLKLRSDWASWATWILADTAVTSHKTALFEPVKLSDDTIALRNVANNAFCKRLTEGKNVNCLAAAVSSVTPEARFKVVEAVSSRTISNYDFHLMNARVYNETFDTMSSHSYNNNTSTPELHTYNLTREQQITTTWSSTISMRLSVKASFRMGIPVIAGGKVTIGAEVSGEYTWGKTTVDKTTTSHGYEKLVPPGKKVTMRLVATHGVCDVPFSYTQRDILYTGETVVKVMDDGIYTGANYYSYVVQSFEEPVVKNLSSMEAEADADEPEWKTVGTLSESGELIPIEEPQVE